MTIERVAVLGAGTMGSGIAAQLVLSGYAVELFDPDTAALERASQRVAKRTADQDGAGSAPGLHREVGPAVEDADLVIEAAPEVMELKRSLFAQVDAAAPARAVMATNTSELSVTFIAAATGRPEAVVGMHWFNPPERMKLIELVRAVRNNVTIDWTLRENVRARMRVLVKRILRRYGYPPDKQEKATQTVLEQAEVLCRDWAVA